jgi:hypothetical protein
MTIFRVIVNRIFFAGTENWAGSVVLAIVLGVLWFILTFFCLLRVIRSNKGNVSAVASNGNAKKVGGFSAALAISAAIACVMSLTAWLALYWNDVIFFSRLLPWIAPLIRVQDPGFHTASRLFPCQKEGFDTGCEAYKWIPAFLIADLLAYFPFVLGGVLCYRRSSAARTILSGALRSVRWGAPLVVVGLCTLLVLHELHLDTQDSLLLNPGIAHRHFGGWELLNDTTGTVIVIAGFLLPFYFYRVFRKSSGLSVTRCRLSELTALTTVILAALMLGNVYHG